jgi:hypothetical protein
MPILGTTAPTPQTDPVGVPEDDRRLEFRRTDGTDIIDWSGDEWIARVGATGLDSPPREVIRDRVPGLPGSRLLEIRDTEREVFLPLHIRSLDGDYRTVLQKLARLRGHLGWRDRPTISDEGSFDLVAVADGSNRSLRCVLLEGMEGDYGRDVSFSAWRIIGLRLLAADPFWRGQEWTTPPIQLPESSAFLSATAVFPRALGASVAFGAAIPVTIGGDVPSAPVIDITGPATTATITSPQGLAVSVGAVPAGQTLRIDTGRTLAVTLDGVPAWGSVGTSPQWAPLPPGAATITIAVTGAAPATKALVHGRETWETAW